MDVLHILYFCYFTVALVTQFINGMGGNTNDDNCSLFTKLPENENLIKIKVIILYKLGNNVTVMSPEGIPIQVNAAALQSASLQNVAGMIGIDYSRKHLNDNNRVKIASIKY